VPIKSMTMTFFENPEKHESC
jgi:hypothetical protein